MAGRYPDDEIALTLNRLRVKTGAGHTWSGARVRYVRKHWQLPAYQEGQPEDRTQAAQMTPIGTGQIAAVTQRQLLAD
jgi:hypothetical protein